ncbi:MAG: hypothetical protein AB1714_02725 [Acidobacteriota bacterium]
MPRETMLRETKRWQRPRRETLYKLPLVLEPQPGGAYRVSCQFLPESIAEGDMVYEAIADFSRS